MYQKPMKTDDLNPDKIKVIVAWDTMVIGASVFVPCVDTDKAKQQISKIATLKGWTLETRVRIENDMFGVRIWRIL
jgi:hypothetical protein